MACLQTTLGLRNNNPFNIRRTSDNWKGMSDGFIYHSVPASETDFELLRVTHQSFVVFDNLLYGLRAGLILLKNYVNKYGCDTPEKIIQRFAPASENNTEAYISFVCRGRTLDPYPRLDRTCVVRPYNAEFLIMCTRILYYESRLIVDIEALQSVINKFNL